MRGAFLSPHASVLDIGRSGSEDAAVRRDPSCNVPEGGHR